MNKIIKALSLSIFLSVCALAQTTTQNQNITDANNSKNFSIGNIATKPQPVKRTSLADDYNKNEYYVGYSFQRVDNGAYQNFNGAEFSYVRNINSLVGIKADVSGTFRKDRFAASFNDPVNGSYTFVVNNKSSKYNVLGGVQIKNNASTSRLKPFGHALAGIQVNRFETEGLVCASGTCPTFVTNSAKFTFTSTRFSTAFGGGLDIRINDKFDFRAIQADYNPTFGDGTVQNNFRFGIGLVIK